jgi:hypothetical protein
MTEIPVPAAVEATPISAEPQAPAPSEAPATDPQQPTAPEAQPQEQPQAEPQAPAEPQFYELPDGRKVDGQTLAREWKENFLPDYTRKSQALAQINRTEQQPVQQQPNPQFNNPQAQPPADSLPWRDPNWTPQTYAEIIEAAKFELQTDLVRQQQEAEQARSMVNQYVDSQINEIKRLDPNLNENTLFQHAIKYNFTDLSAAYQNMKDLQSAMKSVEQRTVQNIKTREADPIAVKPGAGEPANSGVDYRNISNGNITAAEYLRMTQGK